jgi:hypothetical protein
MRRFVLHASALASTVLALTACYDNVVSVYVPNAPTGLYYQLEPSGDPLRPLGIVLRWDPVNDANLESYRVYSRATQSDAWGLRGSTSSPSFHDDGIPHLEYYVTSVSHDGGESDPSQAVLVDERLRLPAPATLTSISLNGAVHLQWSDNAYRSDPSGFAHYRIYSADYNLDNSTCAAAWSLEGTTVASSFLAADLTNGRPRCFGVSAVTIEGFESLWSPLRYDTPRPDGRNLVLFTTAADPSRSGFRFFLDANNDGLAGPLELGLVGAGASSAMDFFVQKDAGGNLLLVPQRSSTTVRLYGAGPVADLTYIDIAPVGGYARTALQAVPQYGYVFKMNEGDGFYRYGALRVSAVGTDYVIFDWSYQTDPGNPELLRVRRTNSMP